MATNIRLSGYNICVKSAVTSPEFDTSRPLASALEVLRAIFFSPRSFYLNFRQEGPVREPVIFILLVSAVTGVLSFAVTPLRSAIPGTADASLGGVALWSLAFVVLSPLAVGFASAAYLLSIRTFVGKTSSFAEVYRILGYAYGAMILFWIPVIQAFAFAYAFMVLGVLGIRSVYRTSFLTALITTLVGFVPTAILFIVLISSINGVAVQ